MSTACTAPTSGSCRRPEDRRNLKCRNAGTRCLRCEGTPSPLRGVCSLHRVPGYFRRRIRKQHGQYPVESVPEIPGKAAQIIAAQSAVGASADMVAQSVAAVPAARICPWRCRRPRRRQRAMPSQAAAQTIGFSPLHCDERMGMLSPTGSGMRLGPEISYRFFRALAEAEIPISLIPPMTSN